jgi:hypothetical protein
MYVHGGVIDNLFVMCHVSCVIRVNYIIGLHHLMSVRCNSGANVTGHFHGPFYFVYIHVHRQKLYQNCTCIYVFDIHM